MRKKQQEREMFGETNYSDAENRGPIVNWKIKLENLQDTCKSVKKSI